LFYSLSYKFVQFLEYKNRIKSIEEEIYDIEDLVTLGRTHSICPYYLAKGLQSEADIVFLPYNYIVDPLIRKTLAINLHNSIVIFDEAHNLVSVHSTPLTFCER
jgi:regulator of telomere elongation helicase 1